VINTHGYVKAFGTMILNDLIKIVSPDLIINLTKVGNQLEDESDG
jgi:polynucleotide 5'-kinase involved in rRNA processing